MSSLDHAMDWLRQGALAPDSDADPRRDDAAFDARARLFAQVFRGRDGEVVLQTILDASLFRPPVDHRLPGEAYLRYAQLREGQNQVAALILAYLDHARDLEGTLPHAPHADAERDPDLFAGRAGLADSLGWSDPRLAGDPGDARDGVAPDPRASDWNIALR